MTLNKQALREAAEKATPGQWEMEQENIWYMDAEGYTKHLMYAQQGDDVDDRQDHYNTAFIATANPTTILALLDELEAANELVELQRFKLERQAEDLHQAKSLESIHREKRFEVEREFSGYKDSAERNSMRLAKEVCRLEDELEAAGIKIKGE